MVFFFGYQPEKLQASMYLLIYTVFSSLPLLLLFLRLGGFILFFPQGVGIWFTSGSPRHTWRPPWRGLWCWPESS